MSQNRSRAKIVHFLYTNRSKKYFKNFGYNFGTYIEYFDTVFALLTAKKRFKAIFEPFFNNNNFVDFCQAYELTF